MPTGHPTRLVPLGFLIAILVGTVLLMLPIARQGPGGADFITALFTATSAVCLTGLVIVNTASYWTDFGHVVILALIQIGGLGIMAGATLMGLLVSRRLGLRTQLLAQAETRVIALGEVRSVLRLTLLVTLLVEAAVWMILAARLRFGHDEPWSLALWNGLFHAVSSFNNAGFSTYTSGLVPFVGDAAILLPIMAAVVIGGIGFPVLADLRGKLGEPAKWALHTKITLFGTSILFFIGMISCIALEWTNVATLGSLGNWERFLGAAFHSVMSRSGGLNVWDVGEMKSETLAITNVLMFVGGGSAGTAGGIKVTTFLILGYVVWSEIRGEADTVSFRRRISREVQRQAMTIVLLGLSLVGAATIFLLIVSDHGLEKILFEVISAFATVGLSAGITADLPATGQMTLIILMFVGRVGIITFATGLALRDVSRPFRYPEERPIVG